MQSYNMILEGFKADDLMLCSEADFSSKIAEMDKLKALEIKKIEKQLKIQKLEFNDLAGQCSTEKHVQ
jgi:hypothetical protein